MRAYDYLLYDNRTRSTLGRDWGLKAATGELAARSDLKQRFYDYCALSFDTSRSSLADFGHAIGGLGDPRGSGYLLCVTLESRDHLERPSCTILGIWLPRRRNLDHLLRDCDPVASARRLLAAGGTPDKLVMAGVGDPGVRTDPWNRGPVGLLREFRPGVTPRRVLGMLPQTRSAVPPSVLGVTALVAPGRFRAAGFDLVFCLPPDAASRTVLEKILAGQAAVAVPSTREEQTTGNPESPLSRWRSVIARLVWRAWE